MRKILIPTNTDKDGNAICIKSNYMHMGSTNFKPQIGGGRFAAMGVIELMYEDNQQVQFSDSV